jgi:hypothetical protein
MKKITCKAAAVFVRLSAVVKADSIGIRDIRTNIGIATTKKNLEDAHNAYVKTLSPIMDQYVCKDEKTGQRVTVVVSPGVTEFVFIGNTPEEKAANRKAYIDAKIPLDEQDVDIQVFEIKATVVEKATGEETLTGEDIIALGDIFVNDLLEKA